MVDVSLLSRALGDLEEKQVLSLVDKIARDKGSNVDSAINACQEGLAIVGQRFEVGEYFVGDLIFAGDLMTRAVAVLRPLMDSGSRGKLGKMVICTVKGDLHDIGKNIVKSMLEAAGFDMIDLGIDTPPGKIVAALKESGAKILGMSGVLTLAIDSMKKTVEELVAKNMRKDVKIIIGGAPVTAEYCKLVGADAWSTNAAQSVKTCKGWIGG